MSDDAKFDLPGKFESGKKYLMEGDTMLAWQKALKADRIVPGTGLKESQTPQGRILNAEITAEQIAAATPFQLKVGTNATDDRIWWVTRNGGSITEETNGAAIDLGGISWDDPEIYSSTTYVVIEASVAAGVISSWTLTTASAADAAKEVEFDSATPPAQNKLRLYIGKASIESGEPVATQGVASSQLLVNVFINGAQCKGFASYQSHPSA